MTCIGKIVSAFAILQVTLVLAKPYELENDGGLYHSNDAMDDFFYKRGAERCNVAPNNRIDCGWGGITRQQCESKGCCFDDSISGVIWCFKTADCGSGCELKGCFSQRCRSSCKSKEREVAGGCSGGDKCCMCHVGWKNGCAYDN